MTFKINKTELIIILLLLASFQIDSFQYFLPAIVATAFNFWMPLIVCCIMTVRLILKRHVSDVMLYSVIFFLFLITVTLYKNPENFRAVITQVVPLLTTALVTEYYMQQNPLKYLHAVLILLTILIALDIFSIILFPNGMYASEMYTECWFLGYKTARVRLATMPVVMVAAIISIKKYNKLNFKFWLLSVMALVDTLLSQNMGGVIIIALMLLLLFLLYGFKHEKTRLTVLKLFNFKFCLVIILILTVAVNIMQILSFFEPIMQAVAEKNTSMIARTRIWTTCIQLFQESPLVGNGYVLSRVFANLVGFPEATQPHSLVLAVLVYSGLIGFLFFLIIINKALSYVNTRNENSASPVCAVYIICILVHGIISMHLFAQFFFAAMVMLYYIGKRLDGR